MASPVSIRMGALLFTVALAAVACTSSGGSPPGSEGTAASGSEGTASAAQPPGPAASGTIVDGVTVTGAGVATGEPDVVRVIVGVEVRRDAVQQALDDANAATAQVIDALDDSGVAAEDRETRDFAVQPDHGRPPEDGGTPSVTGYVVRNLVEATVRDVGSVGQVVQAATEAAGDDARVQGVMFDLEDDGEQIAAAREAALDDAREKAAQYADLAGVTLGELVAIEDQTVSSPRPASLDDAAQSQPEAGVPIEPGQQDVTVQVVTRWAFE